MPTMKDVANHAGVSIATVSHVLNQTKRITPAVVDRVKTSMQEIGYLPNSVARALRTGQTKMLGFIVPDITNPFFPLLIQSIEAKARTQGYATVLLESGYNARTEAQGLEFLIQRGVDGIIWVFGGSKRRPAKPPVPTVVIDYAPKNWISVRADDYAGGRLQASFALEAGQRQVALLLGLLTVSSIQVRRRGFYDESQNRLGVTLEIESPFTFELPPSVAQALIDKHKDYSLLICSNDVLAIAAMKVLRQAGIAIPKDVSVLGFDDSPLSEIVEPALSTIAQPTEDIATIVIDHLLRQIQGLQVDKKSTIVPVQLVERGSTKRI